MIKYFCQFGLFIAILLCGTFNVYAEVSYCGLGDYANPAGLCRSGSATESSSSTDLFPATAGGLTGCLRATRHTVVVAITGEEVGYWSECIDCDIDRGFTRQYYDEVPYYDSIAEGLGYAFTHSGYICCGVVTSHANELIMSPSGYYGYVGTRNITKKSASHPLCSVSISCSEITSCTCVDGFVSSGDNTCDSDCTCVLDTDNGYMCHITECDSGEYISDDGVSCTTCPDSTDSDLWYNGGSYAGATLGTATSVHGCYMPSGISLTNDYGHSFNYNSACYYAE